MDSVYPRLKLFGHVTTVREGVHLYEYAALGILVVYITLKKDHVLKSTVLSLIICASFSNADQLLRLLIPGREYDVVDLGYDAIGYVLGITGTLFVMMLYFIIKSNNTKNGKRP